MLVNTLKILKSSSGTPSQSHEASHDASNKSDSKSGQKTPAKSGVKLNSKQPSVSIQNSNSKVQKASEVKNEASSDSKSFKIQEIKLFDRSSLKSSDHLRSKSPSKSGNKSDEKRISAQMEKVSVGKSSPKSVEKSKSNVQSFFKSLFHSKKSEIRQESIPESSEEEDYDPHGIKNVNSTPYIKIIKNHPEYANPEVENIYRSLGKFDVIVNYTIKLMYKKQILINKDQSIYTGFVDKKGRPSDVGVVVWPSGVLHEGRFSVGQAWGHGRRITGEAIIYEGDWDDGMLEGQGRIESSTMQYTGSVSKNLPHGRGTESWQNGDIFEGEFFEGRKNGRGKFTWQNGCRYEGMLENNTIHGTGTYTWADGRSYTGDWKKNMMDGEGRFEWPDGRVYHGQFAKGKREGYGILDWPNNNRFDGYFKNGKYEGEGTMYMPSRYKIIKAIYSDGQIDKILYEREYYSMEVFVKSITEPAVLIMPKNSPPLEELKKELEIALEPPDLPPPIIILKADEETIRRELKTLHGPFSNHPLYKKLLLFRDKLGPFIYDFHEFDFDVDVNFNDWALNPDGYYKGEMNGQQQRHGRGVFLDKCSIYEGYFRDNKFEGLGRYFDIYEVVYEGYWSKGLKSGFGCMWIKDISFYCGEWERGFKHGVGRIEEEEYTYEGEFDIDIMQGKGRIDWKTNCSYKGDFKKNLPHGYGVYVSFDGQGFTGVWRKGHLAKAATNAMNDIKKIENESNMSIPSILSVQTPRSHNSFNELPSNEIKPPPMDRDSILDSSDASRVHFGALPKPIKRSTKPAERDSLLFDPNHSQVRFSKSSGPIKGKLKAAERDSLLFEPNDSHIKFPASTRAAKNVNRMEERDSLLFDPSESQIHFGPSGKALKFIKDAGDRDSVPSESEESDVIFGEVSEYSIEDSVQDSIGLVDSEPSKLNVSLCPREIDIPDEMSYDRLDDPRFEDNFVPADSFSINFPIINSINSFASEYNKRDYSDDDFELNKIYLNSSHVKRPLDSANPEANSSHEPENQAAVHAFRNLTVYEKFEIKKQSGNVSEYEPIYERQEESRYIGNETDLKGRVDQLEDAEAWSDIEEEKIPVKESTHLYAKFPSPMPQNGRYGESSNSVIMSCVDEEHSEMLDASISSKDARRDAFGGKSRNISLSSTSYIKFPTPSNKHTEASYRPTFTEEVDESYLRYLKEPCVHGEDLYEQRHNNEKDAGSILESYPQSDTLSRKSDQIDNISEFYYQPADYIQQTSQNEEYSVDSQRDLSSSVKSRKSKQKKYSESYDPQEVSNIVTNQTKNLSGYYADTSYHRKNPTKKSSVSYDHSEFSSINASQSKIQEISLSRAIQNKKQEVSDKNSLYIASEGSSYHTSSNDKNKFKQSSANSSKSQSLKYDESYSKQIDNSRLEHQYRSSKYLDPSVSNSKDEDPEDLMRGFSYSEYSDMVVFDKSESYSKHRKEKKSDISIDHQIQSSQKKHKHKKKHKRRDKTSDESDAEGYREERRDKKKKQTKRRDSGEVEYEENKNKTSKHRKEASSGREEQDSGQERKIKRKERNRDTSSRYIPESEVIEDSDENIQVDSIHRSEDKARSRKSHRRPKGDSRRD